MFGYRTYWHVVFICVSAFLLFMPKKFDQGFRNIFLGGISPIWKGLHKSSLTVPSYSSPQFFHKELEKLRLDKKQLQEENYLLKKQIDKMQAFLQSRQYIESELDAYELIKDDSQNGKSKFESRLFNLKDRLSLHLDALPANVVYREPTSWSSFIWVNKGRNDNEILGKEVIRENSPVVLGNVVVGVVEYVGATRSKVRLIFDENLTVAVRATRGHMQNKVLFDHLSKAIDQLKFKESLFFSKEEQVNTLKILNDILSNIETNAADIFMAKGELSGSLKPSWRGRSQRLKGVGFNYNFSDEKGEAIDLFQSDSEKMQNSKVLLKEGDLLLTTGMDGVFPEGLVVGIVSKVKPLEESAFSYEIEALAKAPHMDDLEYVTILPSLDSF